MTKKTTPKSEETRARILEAALTTFRERGFERATMREVAQAAQVATGAAYYYFDSKEAIVMAFYQRAQEELRPEVERALETSRTFEARVRAIVTGKLRYFAPNRALLGALSAHSDPAHPLSPFSEATQSVRDEDVAGFARAVEDSHLRLPKQVAPYLPRLLWLYQMGIILFWVYDSSPKQQRTEMLLEKTLKMMTLTLKIAGLPFLRPMHRLAGELLETVYGKA
ncbi:MAG TPA: TetR family transcriptional regulator [Acidobacteriaceae bacterium]|nr:TetR family transcriptional regulator [Acidobacteriaceae bacterium]